MEKTAYDFIDNQQNTLKQIQQYQQVIYQTDQQKIQVKDKRKCQSLFWIIIICIIFAGYIQYIEIRFNEQIKLSKLKNVSKRLSFEDFFHLTEQQQFSLYKQKLFDMKYPPRRYKQQNLKEKAYFANSILTNPLNQNYQQAQKYRNQLLYHISKYSNQLSLCVSVVGKSSQDSYENLIKSIFRQQYNNYKIVFIDNFSSSNVVNKIKYLFKQQKYLKSTYSGVNITTHQIYNQEQESILKNRHNSIVNYCSNNDIIVQLDTDGQLIGTQVFQLISKIYQRSKYLWVIYFSHMYYVQDKPFMNQQNYKTIPQQISQKNTYRASKIWKTTPVQTYKRQLYMKLDTNDFYDSKGNYFVEKSDKFIHYGLVELAGKQHMAKIDEAIFFYHNDPFIKKTDNKLQEITQFAVKLINPYQNLASLEDLPKKVQNYKVPQNIMNEYQDFILKNPEFKDFINIQQK